MIGEAFQEDTSVLRAHRGHRLGVLLTDADVAGESFYNAMLPELVPASGTPG